MLWTQTYRVQRAAHTDHANAGVVPQHEIPCVFELEGYLYLFNAGARWHPSRVEAQFTQVAAIRHGRFQLFLQTADDQYAT